MRAMALGTRYAIVKNAINKFLTNDSLFSRLDFVFDCCLHLTTYYWISALMLTTFAFMAGGRRVVCKKCNVENIIKLCSDFKVRNNF